MVVDAAEENLRLLKIMLADDYHVNLCRSGSECISTLSEVKPDLVLLDAVMPEIDGYELCRRIKSDAETSNTPVIFVSAGISTEEKLAGYEAGGEEYVTKPFDVVDLLSKIETTLAIRDEELKLQRRAVEAQAVAQEALVSSSELGILNTYSRMCGHAETYEALAECFFETTRSLGINCSLYVEVK